MQLENAILGRKAFDLVAKHAGNLLGVARATDHAEALAVCVAEDEGLIISPDLLEISETLIVGEGVVPQVSPNVIIDKIPFNGLGQNALCVRQALEILTESLEQDGLLCRNWLGSSYSNFLEIVSLFAQLFDIVPEDVHDLWESRESEMIRALGVDSYAVGPWNFDLVQSLNGPLRSRNVFKLQAKRVPRGAKLPLSLTFCVLLSFAKLSNVVSNITILTIILDPDLDM